MKMKMQRYGLLAAIPAACAALMMAAAPAFAADIVLKASHNANPDEPYHTGMQAMSKLLKEKTKGKAEIKVFSNAQLGDETESIQGTKLGTVDIAVTANEVLVDAVPGMSVFSLPYLFKDAEHMERVAQSQAVLDDVNRILAQKGYQLLGLFFAGTRNLMTKEPIQSIDDMKGRKLRTLTNKIHIDAFKAFGANPTPMPYTELYGALETGVVDGAEAANTNYLSRKFYEVAPNWAMIGWTEMMAPVIMGKARFEALPKDVQTALLEAGKEAAIAERKAYMESDKKAYAALEKLPVKITRPDKEPFRQAVKKTYDKFLQTDDQKHLFELIRSVN